MVALPPDPTRPESTGPDSMVMRTAMPVPAVMGSWWDIGFGWEGVGGGWGGGGSGGREGGVEVGREEWWYGGEGVLGRWEWW